MLDTVVDPLELVPDPKITRLFGVSLRSLARWDADEKNDFPRPIVINGRKYRRRAAVEAWLQKRALAALKASKPKPAPPHKTQDKKPSATATQAPEPRRPGRPREAPNV